MLRTLIVDDEPAARERLRQLLVGVTDVDIAGEAGDGLEAIEKITTLKPDLVLLDIQMPGCSGLDVAASLPEPRPRIVFCTAYDQYALDAFELSAVDYLLKPVNRARLAQAIERARAPRQISAERAAERALQAAPDRPTRFLAKHGNRYHVIAHDAVLCIVSEGGLTKIVTADSHYWLDPTLNDLENRLDPASFFRISRAAIVNLHAVKQVAPRQGGAGQVVLNNGLTLEISRRRYQEFLTSLQAP